MMVKLYIKCIAYSRVPMKKDFSPPTCTRFYAAMMLSRRIPNAGLDNQQQRKQAIHAWAVAIKAALRERG